VQAPELPGASDVGDGLAGEPARDERIEGRLELRRGGFTRSDDPGFTRPAKDVTRQQFGIECGLLVGADAIAKSRGRLAHESRQRRAGHPVASFSFSAWVNISI